MNIHLVVHVLGTLAMVIGAAMLPSLGIALFGETNPEISAGATQAFVTGILICGLGGLTLRYLTHRHRRDRITASEGFAVAGLGWILAAGLGAIPMVLCRGIESGLSPALHFSFIDAYFESMSGFTTTGSSVFGTLAGDGGFGAIEALPRSFLFWRSLTHWLGGMGIVVLCLAILPALRAGGYQMFQAEVPGPTAERLQPRIRETAAILWGVYILLSVAEALLLRIGGMPFFDSLCHTFGTMATGGFSTRDASIGAYSAEANGLYFEIIIDLFMFLAGCNFLLHFKALHGEPRNYFKDAEFRFYCFVLAAGILLITVGLQIAATDTGIGTSFRQAVFQVLSITTTTGFATVDFNLWPGACRILMVLLMFFGGCAGSTGGGLKQVRLMVAFRYIQREMMRLLRPRLFNRIQIGEASIEDRLAGNIIGLVLLYFFIFGAASFLLLLCLAGTIPPNADSPDGQLVTAVTAVAATLNNIGPGLSGVGATNNFHWMPDSAKILLSLCMLLGRLEVYSVIVILLPHAWRK
ncbi:MAG: TrkH family potassium uptake protein [Planctomycetota bacterium]|jgi:trk system potassium uptake protein TrkH